jgi:hypothetical protein
MADTLADQAHGCDVNLAQANQGHQQGYALLCGAIPWHWLSEFRSVFDARILGGTSKNTL